MSGNPVRITLVAALLALVMALHSLALVVPPAAQAVAPAVPMAEEYGTTAS
jgi:hypothetical protein